VNHHAKEHDVNYLEIINRRRSVYTLTDRLPIGENELVGIVEETVVATPSPFNMQSGRAVILLGEQHKLLWDTIVYDTLKAIVPEDAFETTAAKLSGFTAGAGTILFLEDQDAVDGLKERFPTYDAAFDGFAAHALGMIEVNVWNALAEQGIGANLQHYNPLIDDMVESRWGIPASWMLASEMVFGGIARPAGPIEKLPAGERVRVIQ